MADQPTPELAPDQAEAPAPDRPEPPSPERAARRKRLFGILALALGAIALLALAYHFLIGVRSVSTDNAYVGADSAQITPLVAGPVASIRVDNTQAVHKGDILVVLDDTDARIALARAEADLAAAEREYRQTAATGGALSAQIAARTSDIARAEAEQTAAQAQFDKATSDLQRREKLAGSGAVSGDEMNAARTAVLNARAQLGVARAGIAQARATRTAARQSYAANQALTAGPIGEAPDVAAARARRDQARIDLDRTVIRAPIDGVIAQRNIQVGQRLAMGTPIMTVVPLADMFVDANFKESQLAKVRVGQSAELKSDLYGGGIKYHGKVIGFSGGTGSAFALIPAQNATGNWIKVVQRLPVRIALDRNELAQHPLRVGLSMDATIDVADQPAANGTPAAR